MASLTIKGDIDQLTIIAKSQKARAKKHKLEVSLDEDKKGGAVNPPLVKDPTAKDIANLIALCDTMHDLEQYKGDSRQVVKAAYNKKLKELE